ncbi:MAG: hypothetical protein K2J78_07135, partial [Muribaculaceae bacterium]|nr:hypothetical protein [Muribaculaceae bacterium]
MRRKESQISTFHQAESDLVFDEFVRYYCYGMTPQQISCIYKIKTFYSSCLSLFRLKITQSYE